MYGMRHSIHISHKKQIIKLEDTDIVCNLSNRHQSIIERNVLNKGLKYGITNISSTKLLKTYKLDTQLINRKLQIKYIFAHLDNHPIIKFTWNPDWLPSPPLQKTSYNIHGFTQYLLKYINRSLKKNKFHHNISQHERLALKNLAKDSNIIIQRADKGGCIAILNASEYRNKINTMLSDDFTYTPIATVNLFKAKQEVDNIINSLYSHKYLTKSQKFNQMVLFNQMYP